MAPRKAWNPLAFKPAPVTFFSTVVYISIAIGLLVTQVTVPKAPADLPYTGVNLTEAWQDLQFLTDGYHPYNSRRNDEVHDWLLRRLTEILLGNGAKVVNVNGGTQSWSSPNANVTVFNDRLSNLTFSSQNLGSPSIGSYFESTNIIVYIRGKEDEAGPWWENHALDGPSGTLVNAHYDSVSTGFGATDDGMGVTSVMQLVKHFTIPQNQPLHGIIALFNNGEEDFLNGARAFAQHPVSRFPTAFLNLEGAGAGGRAAIFRTTDTEVTRAYRGTEHPYGTVVINDGFKRGLVRSETDYKVFNGDLGMRGVDVAFVEPRSRYHTAEDDARDTSVDSLWHMLSAALHTMHGLSKVTWEKGGGSDGVWFDLFGASFVDMELHSLFAISVTLLVIGPVALIGLGTILSGSDRLYVFKLSQPFAGQVVPINGLHGFFRTPFIIAVPSAMLIALAFLIAKVNPFIISSSPYAVWSMMLSIWIFGAWSLSKIADFARPSALHRLYSWLWLFVIFWILLVAATALQDNAGIASGYFIVWSFFAYALATLIGFSELFTLEKRSEFIARQVEDTDTPSRRRESGFSRNRRTSVVNSAGLSPRLNAENTTEEAIDVEPTETTSLLGPPSRTTFANYASSDHDSVRPQKWFPAYRSEQEWSGRLPVWTWLAQLLIAAPLTLILSGQIGLTLTSGLNQTLADGSSALTVYLLIGTVSVLMLLPLTPLLHRFTYHIPTFLLLVFIGTLIYNLAAFPFSSSSRLKVYFIQKVNLDTGMNRVSLASTDNHYITDIVRHLPSAAGQVLSREPSRKYSELVEYSWTGLPPQVVAPTDPMLPPQLGYTDWLSFNASRTAPNKAHFSVRGRSTRSCRILFDKPISDFRIEGGSVDSRFPTRAKHGIHQVRLWSREWENTWEVSVTWPLSSDESFSDAGAGQDGRIACLWNEEHPGAIPALREFRRFAPKWSSVTKLDDGLVEGYKTFFV